MTVLSDSSRLQTTRTSLKAALIVAVAILLIGGILAFKTTNRESETTQNPAGTNTAEQDQNQQKCESIASAQKVSDFAGYKYSYQTDITGFSGDFSCFYTTVQGPGSRVVAFKMIMDADETEFQSAKDISAPLPADEFGDAFYLKNEFPESTTPEWSLHAHKNGKTYIVDGIQYQPEADTKAFIKEIYEKLAAEAS